MCCMKLVQGIILRDGSDEFVYKDQNENGGIECDSNDIYGSNKKCLLPSKYICDGRSHCIDGRDECLCNSNEERKELLNEKCFHCLNHPTIIKFGNLCDGIFHCPDLSDECICRKRGPPPEICNHVDRDKNQPLSPQWKCSTGNNSHKYITTSQICDERVDCEDASDETNCENNCAGSILADGEVKTCKKDYPCPHSG
ncbi:uncharacterized protein LOC120336375 [Styela clava]